MSYYINHALKLTFKEYNKFVKHCRDYIDDDIMYKFNISDKEIMNGTFMDKLFEDIFMDNDSMCINTTCSVFCFVHAVHTTTSRINYIFYCTIG